MQINYLKLFFCLTFSGISIFIFIKTFYTYFPISDKVAYTETDTPFIPREDNTLHELKRNRILHSTKINDEICTFWRVEHSIEPTEGSKAFMYAACELAARLNSQSVNNDSQIN
ncbi:hypothetical protein [Pseudoalteromonas arabiensis]|uniref:hypothetical protein n=1 Tax=Pseudoalteromonas arabiensis TaxID=874454 RepID=UPI0007831E29|nr:hypothetical protein [Pseudoalteromonas arabiensis]